MASDPLAYSLKGAAAATGVSTKTIERAIKARRLKAKRSSEDEDGEPAGVYVILAAELIAWLDGLPDA